MTAATKHAASNGLTHPSASQQVETKLEARHIEFVFEPNLPIANIREVEGNQVRLSEHRAPKDMVDRYAQQMSAGATFPAIVVNDQLGLVDGNTRLAAAIRNKRDTIAAYICSGLSSLQARSLSVELNQSHGLSMTEDEIRAFVVSAVADGHELDVRALSRMTGVKASTLRRWVAVTQFQTRAQDEGISEDVSTLSDGAQVALNVARLKSVFRSAVALAVAAKVPARQLKPMVARANTARSEAEALQIIETEREARADAIAVVAAGFKVGKRRSAGSALHIGGLLRFEVADLLDVAPEKQPEMFERLRVLQSRINETLELAKEEWRLPGSAPAEYAEVA